jgi:predicted deacylase
MGHSVSISQTGAVMKLSFERCDYCLDLHKDTTAGVVHCRMRCETIANLEEGSLCVCPVTVSAFVG